MSEKIEKKSRKAIEKTLSSLEVLAIEYADIKEVKPNKYNPNRQSDHEFELLKRSISEDGFTQPIIVHRESKEIVDGEHRWMAAQALGMKTIPVVYVSMTPEQMRIATLRHNRARGSEDIQLSAQVLRDLRELGALEWAQDSLDLSDVEINKLLDDIPAPEALAGEEFNESWSPTIGQSQTEAVKVGEVTASSTPAALSETYHREQMLKEAKSEEDKKTIRAESKIQRYSFVFTDDEGVRVDSVLGIEPAKTLLKLCDHAIETNWTPEGP